MVEQVNNQSESSRRYFVHPLHLKAHGSVWTVIKGSWIVWIKIMANDKINSKRSKNKGVKIKE